MSLSFWDAQDSSGWGGDGGWGDSFGSSGWDSWGSSLYNNIDMGGYSDISTGGFGTSYGNDFGGGWGADLYSGMGGADFGGATGGSFDFTNTGDIYGINPNIETVTVTDSRINPEPFNYDPNLGIGLDQFNYPVPEINEGGAAQPASPEGTTERHTIMVDGKERSYLLHLPPNADPSKPIPLIVAYNGVASNDVQLGGMQVRGGEHMEAFSGLSDIADREGFAVAYMDGNEDRNFSWNNGEWAFSFRDDVSFTRAALGDVSSNQAIDNSRIYAVGFSQGESFVHSIANDPSMSNTFAAVGVVSGWMTGDEQMPTDSPMPIISFHSVADPTVPIDGAWQFPIASSFAGMESEGHELNYYMERNGITGPVSSQPIFDSQGRNIGTDSIATNPATGAQVEQVTLQDLGHVWPGGVGGASEVNASERIWDFFSNHTNSNPPDITTYTDNSTTQDISSNFGGSNFGGFNGYGPTFDGVGTVYYGGVQEPINRQNEIGTLVEIPTEPLPIEPVTLPSEPVTFPIDVTTPQVGMSDPRPHIPRILRGPRWDTF